MKARSDMCFSYAINFSASTLQTQLQLDNPADWDIPLPWETPTNDEPMVSPGDFLSGFDRPFLPVITRQSGAESPTQWKLSPMRWGLVPHWCKSVEQAHELSVYGLNARAETVDEKPLFRDAWKAKPCLVPASGFFEWQTIGKNKQPYFIHAADEKPLLFAGLYTTWVDTDSGEELSSYSILTTEANGLMAEIHNVKKRMPVILTVSQAKIYLESNSTVRSTMLQPCEDQLLTAYPVGTWLNAVKAQRNVPQALLPIEKDFPQTLF